MIHSSLFPEASFDHIRFEGKFHLGEFMRVDDMVGGYCGEDRFLIFIFNFDVDLALDLVGIDDFDPLLDSIRLFGHNQSAEVKLVFVFKLCGLVHDFPVLFEHLQLTKYLENSFSILTGILYSLVCLFYVCS